MGIYYLVGGIPTPLKNMSLSIGVTIPNIWKAIKKMLETTNQLYIYSIEAFIPSLCPVYNLISSIWMQ